MASLLINNTANSAILGGLSNILAQKISATKEGRAFHLDVSSLVFFIAFNSINCPPNVLWQVYLEEKFPANKVDAQGRKSLDKTNTLRKIILDQTISATANTIAYICALSAFQGRDTPGMIEDLREDFWPLLVSSWKLWPLVSILSFTIIPLQHRILFGSIAGLMWNTYLSLLATGQ